MEDVLDLGEERRRGPATSVRTVAGAGGGRREAGWGQNLAGGEGRLRGPGSRRRLVRPVPAAGAALREAERRRWLRAPRPRAAGGSAWGSLSLKSAKSGKPPPLPPASGVSGDLPRSPWLSGAPGANFPRKDSSAGDPRRPF